MGGIPFTGATMVRFQSVVVHDLHILRTPLRPAKAEAPLDRTISAHALALQEGAGILQQQSEVTERLVRIYEA